MRKIIIISGIFKIELPPNTKYWNTITPEKNWFCFKFIDENNKLMNLKFINENESIKLFMFQNDILKIGLTYSHVKPRPQLSNELKIVGNSLSPTLFSSFFKAYSSKNDTEFIYSTL